MSHQTVVCSCGKQLSTCRCASPHKTTVVSDQPCTHAPAPQSTVWKWQFYVADDTRIVVPKGTKLIRRAHAQDHDVIEVWGHVPDVGADPVDMLIKVRGTNHPTPEGWAWLDTVVAPMGLVWHVYTLPQHVGP